MKLLLLLPVAALSTALVLPDERVFSDLTIQDHHTSNTVLDKLLSKDEILEGFKKHFEEVTESVTETSRNALDDAINIATDAGHHLSDKIHETAFDAQGWFDSAIGGKYNPLDEHEDPPHRRPHHPPHHDKPNMTVYELISASKYSTKLAKLINEYDDLVDLLNGTTANFTVFAPIDKAFEKIPEHAPKPSKEQIKKLLTYHVSSDFYPAGRVLASHTIPTLLKVDSLGKEPLPQRLSRNLGLRGLTLNFYSRIVAIDIFGTNGVIHGIDSLLLPPPNIIKIIDLLPGEFSTLELGLGKTGLLETLNTTDHAGGTFFAPSNFAFQKLGPKINAFLFSTYGQKYLKALLLYHVVPNNTVYSDAFYKAESTANSDIPKGRFHIDLPTMLEDRTLSIDIARYGGLIEYKVNAFARVSVQDGIAEDGVIQVVSDVLIPPKKLAGVRNRVVKWDYWTSEEEMSVEELKERLEPFVNA
ncbi:hypothetical protein LTR66_012543 [Elasticomyces elasticus]|nr:hypothetical protein LTR66_012543 [Elasticomyces elasticus]